jgi:hypothetical protein
MRKNFKTFINEIRRSEKLGFSLDKTKEYGHSAARLYLEELQDSGEDLDLYGVTMTNILKVGINPQSEYYNPTGIYFYPAKYYLEENKLPFQNNAPYINIIKLEPKTRSDIVKFSDIGREQLSAAVSKLSLSKSFIKDVKKHAEPSNAGIWWYFTYKLSDNNPRLWNKILRNKLGISVVIDDLGIMNELPQQGIILDPTVVRVIKRIENKQPLIMNPKNLYDRSRKIGKLHGNLEYYISKDAEYSYLYARDVLKGPFSKGEDVIATNSLYAFQYARDVLKGPFSKGEDAITKDPELAYEYAAYVLKGPFPKGEDAIAKDSVRSYLYARNILRKRFLKGEDAIAKDGLQSYLYARYILRKRFPKGEDAITKSPYNLEYEKLMKSSNK